MASTKHKTASTHRSAVLRGRHEFHIVGYSGRKRSTGTATSSTIKSGSFLAGGHTWALACVLDNQGHLASISLELLSTAKDDVVATAGIRFEDPLGEWPPAVWQSNEANRFQPARSRRSWVLSVPDAYHGHESGYVRDDRLTIQSTVDVFREYSGDDAVQTRNCFASMVSPPTIAQDLHKLLHVDEFGSDTEKRRRHCMQPDVTFVVEETEIQAHKLVLAMRSPVFAAEFRWHTNGTRLSIDDMTASTFRAMLHFIYTDELPIKPSNNDTTQLRACKEKYALRRSESMARDLLVAADRYDLERLRLMVCQNMLLEGIDPSNVMGTLLLVRGRHTCSQLEDSCIEYIASDPEVYAAVMATEEYQELKKSCSPLIIEIMERVATHNVARRSSSSEIIKQRRREKSWSTYTASEEVQGVHEFRIPNFCAVQRSLSVGQLIHSGTFQVGDCNWMLEVYPSGEEEGDQGNIAVYLRLLCHPPAHGVKVTEKYMVLDPRGKSLVNLIKDGPPTTYTKRNEAWGYDELISLESAKSQCLANDGSFTIYADIAVTKQPYTSTSIPTTRATINVPSSSIVLQLEQLLVSEEGSDVKFLVEGSEILTHSLVIAVRSPMLYETVAAAAGDNKDGHVVSINGMKAGVFKAVLRFVYTDELAALGSTPVAEDVLAAASRFGLDRMKIICENFLAEQISQENAFDTLMLARRHHCSELEDYCMDFILSIPSLAKDVMKTNKMFHRGTDIAKDVVAVAGIRMEDPLVQWPRGGAKR